MPPVCAVSHCSNSYLKGFTLVSFPKDANVRKSWSKAIGKGKDWCPRPSDRICEVHFQPTDWLDYKKLLKDGAVPSLLCVGHSNDHNFNQNLSPSAANINRMKQRGIRLRSVKNFKNYYQVRCSKSQEPVPDCSRLKLSKPAVKSKTLVKCDVAGNSSEIDCGMLQKQKDDLEVELQFLKEMLFLKEMELLEEQWVV